MVVNFVGVRDALSKCVGYHVETMCSTRCLHK